MVVILEPKAGRSFVKDAPKKIPITNLVDVDPNKTDAILKHQFAKRTDLGFYSVFVIDERMATGTHFESSSEIETNGGVGVVIGTVPKTIGEFI